MRRRRLPDFYIDLSEGEVRTLSRIVGWLWVNFPDESLPIREVVLEAMRLLSDAFERRKRRPGV